MASNKAALKAAKTALDAEKWDEAITQAQIVLASDAQNYFAKLFLGRAFEKQSKIEDAAKAYHAATEIKPDDPQAWLGLCSLYEDQGSKYVDEFGECSVSVAVIYGKADDIHRCQTHINKLTSFAKDHGTAEQYKRALRVMLPGSPIYDFLEGRIPHPSHTFTRLVELTETEEKQRINKEIGERRTRLGARIGQVTTDVKREVYATSELEHLYRSLIDWSNDDEIRREYEDKLLQRAFDTLVVLPAEQKAAKRDQVIEMARGMVIIKHPSRLAWDLYLEWRDLTNIQDLDLNVLLEYVEFFPDSGLARVLRGFLGSDISPFPQPSKAEDAESDDEQEKMTQEDRLLLMGEGLSDGKGSALAHRLVGEYYLHLEEYDSAIETSRNGLKLLASERQKSGLQLQENDDAISSILATSLVHFQSPRNHPEARTLFTEILDRKPKFTAALIGLGLILEEQEEYTEAVSLLSQALQQDPNNIRIGAEEAWCRALAGDYESALDKLEEYLPNMKVEDPKSRDLRAQTLYRIGRCMWELDSNKSARKDRNGAYARFLSAVKTNVSFAPAYTSLGNYYADYAKDKKRARQCFQKAFELSASEVEAAERLARAFADQGEWEIVEIVAQRVVDSGKVRPPPGSKRKGISWPYSALGVVQMTKQEYTKAITSFLHALRISPEDYHSYVGLGESYHNSGRYNSASRTFRYTEEPPDGARLNVSGEKWFTRYMLANVHRELGEYEEAIADFKGVMASRPEEFGVLSGLLQTFLESAWRCIDTGFFGEAATAAKMAIELADRIIALRPNAFNLWKAVGDACSIFTRVQDNIAEFPVEHVKYLLGKEIDLEELDVLSDVDGVSHKQLDQPAIVNGDTTSSDGAVAPMQLALLAYKRAISACADDIHAQAVAWYNLGWAEHNAYDYGGRRSGKRFLKAAVRCFKRAIELEAGNSEFWNALGIVTTRLNPKVAQHCFVRSLYLNERSVRAWTNLGALYLISNDYELAHQAFGRAQSTDPDYAHAWVGEGLIAQLTGDDKEALSHFTHAVEICDSSSLITKRQYAVSVFDHLFQAKTASELSSLIQPLFALQQLHAQIPHDKDFNHLQLLFSERVGDHTAATTILSRLCEDLEQDYETTESAASLSRFAHAKADMARNLLASKQYDQAAEEASTALSLKEDDASMPAKERTTIRLSAHLTAGLASYFLQRTEDSISSFRAALEESDSDPDVVCLLSQVLYAKGGEDEKSVARDQLLQLLETSPDEHVQAMILLGAMAAIEQDTDTLDAVRDDLKRLRASERVKGRGERVKVEKLLGLIAALDSLEISVTSGQDGTAKGKGEEENVALAAIQTSILLFPEQSTGWTELALASQLNDEDDAPNDSGAAAAAAAAAAEWALLTSKQAVPPHGSMSADDLSAAYAGTGKVGDAQRAICLAPWQRCGWESFEGGIR